MLDTLQNILIFILSLSVIWTNLSLNKITQTHKIHLEMIKMQDTQLEMFRLIIMDRKKGEKDHRNWSNDL